MLVLVQVVVRRRDVMPVSMRMRPKRPVMMPKRPPVRGVMRSVAVMRARSVLTGPLAALRTRAGPKTHAEQALLGRAPNRKHIRGNIRLVLRDHLDEHASMVGEDLHHRMRMAVSGLALLAQVKVLSHSALEARTKELTRAAAITDHP